MEQRMAMGKAVMLVGPAGTGKTQLVMGALRSLMEKNGADFMTSKVNMNFYTRYPRTNVTCDFRTHAHSTHWMPTIPHVSKNTKFAFDGVVVRPKRTRLRTLSGKFLCDS